MVDPRCPRRGSFCACLLPRSAGIGFAAAVPARPILLGEVLLLCWLYRFAHRLIVADRFAVGWRRESDGTEYSMLLRHPLCASLDLRC